MIPPTRARIIPGGAGIRLLFPVRRRLLIAAVFLLAGAVVNVAVAWGCVALKPCSSSAETLTPKEVAAVWCRFARPSLRSVRSASDYDGFLRHGFGLTSRCISNSFLHDVLGGFPGLNADASTHSIWMVEVGWPVRCFRRGWDVIPLDVVPRLIPQSPGVATRTVDAAQHRPLGLGFAVNTLFYAALLRLLISGPFVLRRFIRIRRGLCPACCYPMGESAVCSECGKALPRQVRT